MFSYNTSTHEVLQRSPFELVFGRIATLPSARYLPKQEQLETYDDYLVNLIVKLHRLHELARNNLIKAKIRSKEYYDRYTNPEGFLPGNYVFLKKEKKVVNLEISLLAHIK